MLWLFINGVLLASIWLEAYASGDGTVKPTAVLHQSHRS
jgi:hypothetical protein